MSAKSIYVNQLINAKTTFSSHNSDQDSAYLTYLTSNAMVIGKTGVVDPLDFESYDKIEEALSRRSAEGNPVTIMDVASGLYNNILGEEQDEIANENPSILLEDVQILTDHNVILSLSHFVIFTDQIIGIIPTKVDLHELQSKKNLIG